MKENLIRNSYLNSFNIDDKSKGLEHLIIINTKCLVDDKIQRYVYIDNNRLKDELRYYNFYGTKPSYDDILNILLPLILSNTNIQKCEDEVVSLIQKYVKYLKKEDNLFEYILGAVIYNALMHYLLENKNIEYNDLLQLLKEKIIGFSIELEKLNMIKFQMARINAIQLIDSYIDLKVDDYVTKPFDNKVLVAKINRLLARVNEEDEVETYELAFDELVVNKLSRTVRIDNELIDFRPKEFDLLVFLIENHRIALDRDRILDAVWGIDYFGDTRTVDVHVKRLREKLEGVSDKWELKTVWCVGYKFETRD